MDQLREDIVEIKQIVKFNTQLVEEIRKSLFENGIVEKTIRHHERLKSLEGSRKYTFWFFGMILIGVAINILIRMSHG